MATKIIFNTDETLKAAAQKKARSQGLTLSAMLNLATQAYVNDQIEVDVIPRDIMEARRGKTIPAEEAYRRLGIRQ